MDQEPSRSKRKEIRSVVDYLKGIRRPVKDPQIFMNGLMKLDGTSPGQAEHHDRQWV
jgi:hypothetical protein